MSNLTRLICSLVVLAWFLTADPSGADAAERALRWEKVYQRGLDRAKRESRLLVVVVSAPWCGPCRQMHATTMVDAGVAEVVRRKYVAVNVNADANPALVQGLRVQSYPTTLIMTPDRKVMQRFSGYLAPKQLTQALETARWKPPVPKRGALEVIPAKQVMPLELDAEEPVSALSPANVAATLKRGVRVALQRS